MKIIDKEVLVFFELLGAGLWNKKVQLSKYGTINFNEVYRLSEEQSIIGLIAAGLENVTDIKVPQEIVLQFVGQTLLIEQHNKEMNAFISKLVGDLRESDIYALIVKGQGVAQCYERPLWRASGDVDFYLSDSNFNKAKRFFRPLVDKFDPDNETNKHINMHYGEWVVEIHANQHCSLSARVNRVMDEIHTDIFNRGNVRSWSDGGTNIILPSPDNDVLIVFVHFLNHFYKGGIGLRQICDWCRLLWHYRAELDSRLLESRIKKMGLLNVWKAFAAFAVEYLGMPVEAMPLFNENENYNLRKKAERICAFIMQVGNFGHNRDSSYYGRYPRLIRKAFSFRRRCGDMLRHAMIFPIESLRFFPYMVYRGFKAAAQGE